MKLLIQNIKRLVKIIAENIFLLVGAYIFTLNLFNFESDVYCNREASYKLSFIQPGATRACVNPAVYYYYNNETITYLALGSILIILGLLLIKERYYKK